MYSSPRVVYAWENLGVTGAWTVSEVDSIGGEYPALAVGTSGTPHVAYCALDGQLHYKTGSGATPDWTTNRTTLDVCDQTRRGVGLTLDKNNRANIVYAQNQTAGTVRVRHARMAATGWNFANVTAAATANPGTAVAGGVSQLSATGPSWPKFAFFDGGASPQMKLAEESGSGIP